MTTTAGLPLPTALPLDAAMRQAPNPQAARGQQTAQQFEALLLQQLLKVLRESTGGEHGFGLSGPGTDIYASMFDEKMADHLAEAGGIGLRAALERQWAGQEESAPMARPHGTFQLPGTSPTPALRSSAPAIGASASIQAAAHSMLADADAAGRWSRQGSLTKADLSSQMATPSAGGLAHFNVRDANGYQGYAKCNLFALELTRRAGFQTPVVARGHGWGYPSPAAVASDAGDGSLRQGWGKVVTGNSAEALDARLRSGQSAYIAAAKGTEEHAGHMAVIERVHAAEYAADGSLQRLEFDGWEAREQGAQHLSRRVWKAYGAGGEAGARTGLQDIQLIELQRPLDGPAELPLSAQAPASARDGETFSLRFNAQAAVSRQGRSTP